MPSQLTAPKPEVGIAMHPTPVNFDEAFRSTSKVQGLTHDFYKYPARFSPDFVRFILDLCTEPGDYVLDPFMGGGTTIVEAAASGRHAIGSDVNSLARFVTRVKTTPLSQQDIAEIRTWVQEVRSAIDGQTEDFQPTKVLVRNMPGVAYRFFATATRLASDLRFPRRRQFARCALIRVGQWGLDGRTDIPDAAALSDELGNRIEHMLGGLREFVAAARAGGLYKNKITSTRRLMPYSASDSLLSRSLRRREIRPRLVLTSPPYPGVHVLYHRWQILGRRETPAPYWIADIKDGHGASYYTMGSRSTLGLKNYFTGLTCAFVNLRQIIAPDAIVVQLVSFSDTAVQLPLYLDAMDVAGFEETRIGEIESRQVRSVPNRKWYNQRRPSSDASREVLLLHRLATRWG